jgi:hypothetical protein
VLLNGNSGPKFWLTTLPLLSISPEILYSSLRFFHVPNGARKIPLYFTIISTILWKLEFLLGNGTPRCPTNYTHNSTPSFSPNHFPNRYVDLQPQESTVNPLSYSQSNLMSDISSCNIVFLYSVHQVPLLSDV